MHIELEERTRSLLAAVARYFESRDVPAWATGGFLRDSLLEREHRDIDVTIAGDPLDLGPALARDLDAHFVVLDRERRHTRLVLRDDTGIHLDLTPLRAPDIEGDLHLRDYTIDAFAATVAEVVTGDITLIDPTGGKADLDAELVHVIGEQRLLDDPLRLLRGPRIAAQLGFEIEDGTATLIRKHAALVATPALERQREELMRIFATDSAGRGLHLLEDLGLLPDVLPEMDITRGVEQPKEHYFDVLGHSFAAVSCLDFLLADDEPPDPVASQLWYELWSQLEWCEGLPEYLREEVAPGTQRQALLKFCAFLHDIGKPETKSFQEDGRMRFFGHHNVGAEISAKLMRRLRFSSREIAIVRAMIQAHLRPVQLGEQGAPTSKAIYKFFRDTGEAGIETLLLSLGDHLGSVGPRVNIEGFQRHVAVISYILHERFEGNVITTPVKLISGEEIMAAFDLTPGPLVGRLLEVIREAQALGEVTDADGALALARTRLDQERRAVEAGAA